MLRSLTSSALALSLLSACSPGKKAGFRFRLTVEVATPEGLRRGTSVYQVTAGTTAALAPGGQARGWLVVGEAVAVELPGNRTLFALLRTYALHSDLAGLAMATLDPSFQNDMVESAERIAVGDNIRSPATVDPSRYPLLVTFQDTANPETVREVEPSNLAVIFGDGFRLERIVVEVTEGSVTTGLKRRLPWLTAGSRYVSTGPRLIKTIDPHDHSAIATLAFGDFLSP